jgi:hypothetical protein
VSATKGEFWKRLSETIGSFGAIMGALLSGFAVAREISHALARRRRVRRYKDLATPSRKQARQLEELVKDLSKAQEWLGVMDCEMARTLALKLGRIAWEIWAEALSYVALFSPSEESQCLALRNLSQVEDDGAIERVKRVVQGVIDTPLTSYRVNHVARAALDELERREKIRQRNAWTVVEHGNTKRLDLGATEETPSSEQGTQGENREEPGTS